MTTTEVAGHAYALLADGATAEIRPAGPGDLNARVTSHGAADPSLRQLRMPPAATLAEPAPGGEAAQ